MRHRGTFECIGLHGFGPDDLSAENLSSLASRAPPVTLLGAEPEVRSRMDCLLVQVGQAVDRALLERCPSLKYLGVHGTDCSRVDIASAVDRGIVVTHVPGYATESVAEFAVGVLLAQLRQLGTARARVSAGDFDEGPASGALLRSKCIGVVGLGRIGLRFAELVRLGFQGEVRYWSRRRRPEAENALRLGFLPLLELCRWAEVVAVFCAADAGMLLDRQVLSVMPRGALLLHLSPLDLLELDALEARLSAGTLTLIGDHFAELPAAVAERLARLPGCIAYPAVAHRTLEATETRWRRLLENMDAFLEGERLNAVPAQACDRSAS